MNFTITIQQWFDDEWGGSLLLPDGWYGRPYDNQHMLTSVKESGSTLTIVLDEKLTLHFEGLKSVRAQKHELTFGSFQKLRFDWENFGTDGGCGSKEYQDGEVKILTKRLDDCPMELRELGQELAKQKFGVGLEQMSACPWEEIKGFNSLNEFNRFIEWMEEKEKSGLATEIPVKSSYNALLSFPEKWFRHLKSNEVWRLIWPDPPFTGVFEKVEVPPKINLLMRFLRRIEKHKKA